MTRISDLSTIEEPTLSSVMVISDGQVTRKITVSDLKDVILNPATETELGVVRIGSGLDINDYGVVSVLNYSNYTLPPASKTILGGIKVSTTSGLNIDSEGIITATYSNFNMPIANNNSVGGIKVGSGLQITPSGELSTVPIEINTVFNDAGITIGDDSDIKIFVDGSGTVATIREMVAGDFRIGVKDIQMDDGTSSIRIVSSQKSNSLGGPSQPAFLPDPSKDPMNLGISTNPWNEIHANKFFGNLTGVTSNADKLLVNTSYVSASVQSVANTIPARDNSSKLYASFFVGNLDGIAGSSYNVVVNGVDRRATVEPTADAVVARNNLSEIYASKLNGISTHAELLKVDGSFRSATCDNITNTVAARNADGTIKATLFDGVASSAKYADLAEKYIPDGYYDEGTVVVFGGDNEITVTTTMADHRVAGVISSYPAYLMNKEEKQGLPVALRGKVPVKVLGKVNKGDLLVTSSIAGYAISVGSEVKYGVAVFAKSIEHKTNTNRGTVMAVII